MCANELFISLIWSDERIFKEVMLLPDSSNSTSPTFRLTGWLFVFDCLLNSREFNNASIHLLEPNKKSTKRVRRTCIWPGLENRFKIHTITQSPTELCIEIELVIVITLFVRRFFLAPKWHVLYSIVTMEEAMPHPLYRFIEWAIFNSYLPNQFVCICRMLCSALIVCEWECSIQSFQVYECLFPVLPCANCECVLTFLIHRKFNLTADTMEIDITLWGVQEQRRARNHTARKLFFHQINSI